MDAKNISSEEKILNAAIDEFAVHGFAGARVDSIARRANVNKAMIYYYFKNKENLYRRVISDIASIIFMYVTGAIVVGVEPEEQLYSIIERYADGVRSMDDRFLKILIREFADGGDFFVNILVPNLLQPVISIVEPIFKEGINKGIFRDLNPYMTFFNIIGGIVFFNVISHPLENSSLQNKIFKKNYYNDFKVNMFSLVKNGIELNRRMK